MNFSISSSKPTRVPTAPNESPTAFLGAAALTVVVGLTALCILTNSFRAGFLDPEYGMWVVKQRMVEDCRFGQTLILGDSRAVAGFVPDRLDGVTNLALGGATPIEMYYTAKRIQACPNQPDRIVVSFSPDELMADQYYWRRSALFDFFSFEDLEDVRKTARSVSDDSLYPKATLGDLDARLSDWLYAHDFPSHYAASIINGRLIGRWQTYRRIQQDVERSAGHLLYGKDRGNAEPAVEADIKAFHVSALVDAYFDRLIESFRDAGTPVVFIATPLNQATCALLRPGVSGAIAAYLRDLENRHANFRVLGPPAPCYPNGLFGDSVHLNAQGADVFSNNVFALLSGRQAHMVGYQPPLHSEPQ